jgi:hypothetical protein
MLNSNIILYIIIAININSFIIGYLFGVFIKCSGVSNNNPKSFFSQNKQNTEIEKNNLSIDDKKFVVDIKTDNLERKYENLGDIKKTQENISDSVNKLKNLKR